MAKKKGDISLKDLSYMANVVTPVILFLTLIANITLLNMSRTQIQPWMAIGEGVRCPPYLTTVGFYKNSQYYTTPQEFSFTLTNIGQTPTDVSLYKNNDGVNISSSNFESKRPTNPIRIIVQKKDEQVQYSFNVQPDVSVDAAKDTISFSFYYTYLNTNISVINCKYNRNESMEDNKNTKFYILEN